MGLFGCGYQQSGDYDKPPQAGYKWHSLYRQDISTVAAPIFQNRAFERGVELSLSRAIVMYMEAHTPYKVVSRDRADTILEGEIVDVRPRTLSRNLATVQPQEQVVTFLVNFTWKDLRSGRILVQRRNFEQTATYYPTLGEGRFHGEQDAVESLAAAIVQELQADW